MKLQLLSGEIPEIDDEEEIIVICKTYKFKINSLFQIELIEGGEGKTIKISKGNYELSNGLYLCTPNIDNGFKKENTRYLYLNQNGNLVPGNWITSTPPDNWYNYSESKWANIYVENNGVASYYVWIPRYAYKIPENNVAGSEKTDIIFINTDNSYTDATTGKIIPWTSEEGSEQQGLEQQGYKIPEAFIWKDDSGNDVQLAGYWISKYELIDTNSYDIEYSLIAGGKSFNVKNLKNNLSTNEISKYTYAINGNIVKETTQLEEYTFTTVKKGKENSINITALDSNGRIVTSMTKKSRLIEINAPDLTGFNKNETYYVYWDSNGVEHNDIPISENAPDEWYDYTNSKWANIVTKSNNTLSYFVWIPRYQYQLDSNANPQKANIIFIKGKKTNVENGYKIPEAFTWKDDSGNTKQLKGYWISKYELIDN